VAPLLGDGEGLPDIGAATKPSRKLRDLVDDCTTELNAFSRFLGRQPEARASIAALVLLPSLLRGPALRRSLTDRMNDLLGNQQSRLVDIRELVGLLDMPLTAAGKISANAQEQIAQVLDELDLAMEPDRRYGGRAPEIDAKVTLFRASGGAPIDPARTVYQATRAMVEVALLAAAADGDISTDEIAVITGAIQARKDLDGHETLRLTAFARSQQHDRPKHRAVLKRLQALPAAERETIARSAVNTAMSDGVVTPAEVKFLEQLYTALSLPVDDVYRSIHRFAPTSRASGPATDTPGMATIDPTRLERLRAETQAVSRLLSDIFIDEPASETAPARQVAPAPSPYAGLDASHAALLEYLANAEGSLPREVFDSEARARSLLPDGAIEAINDWAYDYFEEALLDAEDTVNIAAHLQPRLRNMRVPAP
jgi:tellurite resistance protein